MAERTLLQERAAELIEQHGSTRAAGRVLRLSGPYLYRLMTGEATEPTDTVLRKLKLRRIVSYERTETPRRRREPTTCGYCSYEEADGGLIEQCPKCKAADAPPMDRTGPDGKA